MNGQTVDLITRPYQEIVDDILTAMVGGVVREQIQYSIDEDRYRLSRPAVGVRTLTGTLSQLHHVFQRPIDFDFSPVDNAVIWTTGGDKPDDVTPFYVSYFPQGASSPLSDINVGSVTRTLTEAVGREVATVYQQINLAYLSAFVDTATGRSLDLVVAILGIQRYTKDYAKGQVTFFRDPAAPDGDIFIPVGLELTTAKGDQTFVTTQERTLQRGQQRVDVPVSASGTSKGDAGKADANTIVVLAKPMAGISRVSNQDATVLGLKDETDDELRARAKAALYGLGKATLAALSAAIVDHGGKLDEVWDPGLAPPKSSTPGTVSLRVIVDGKKFPGVQTAVDETRAAGVQATVVAKLVYFRPRILATVDAGLTAAGKARLGGRIVDAVQAYVDTLAAGSAADGSKIVEAAKSVKGLNDASIKDVMAWKTDIGKPDPAANLVDALLAAIDGTPTGNRPALRAALTQAVNAAAAPTAHVSPDRSLVTGQSGQATDTEIEAGTFKVVPPDQSWSIALRMDPSDVIPVER